MAFCGEITVEILTGAIEVIAAIAGYTVKLYMTIFFHHYMLSNQNLIN